VSESICHDQRRPSPIGEPHGPWWLTVRIPLPRTGRHLYIGATTGLNRFRGFPFLRVKLARGRLRKPRRSDLLWSLHRWCAHIDVRHPADTPEAHRD
jgi:hypothetical protein